ncbi:MAG: hypothetical protein ACR2GX_03415 [Candidatus Dormibacteria bacterium]
MVGTSATPQRLWSPVRVAEVTAESSLDELPELPMHLLGEPGTVALQLRTMVRRLAMGAGLARDGELVERVRALPGLPGLATSPAGGTFIVGGAGWLGLCAVGVPPPGDGLPLDWMSDSLNAWFAAALAGYGVETACGRVDGAWCPGFSDISTRGRKLIGLGYRVTRAWVVMRGVMPIHPISDADQALLCAAHALINVDVRPEASTSLAEAGGRPDLEPSDVISEWRVVETSGGVRL